MGLINRAVLDAAFSSFNTEYQAGFAGAKPVYTQLATVIPSESGEENYAWLAHDVSLREWIGDRHLKGARAAGFTLKNRTFERTVTVSRDDVEDGRIASRAVLFRMLGEAAAMHPDSLVFKLLREGSKSLCLDGQYFFDTDHPVAGGTVANFTGPLGSPTRWALLDTSRAIKPFIFQRRREYNMVAMDAEQDEAVFMRREYRYGVDARVNAGFGLWQLAYGSADGLSVDAFDVAYSSMMKLKHDNGDPLGIRPTTLVVGPDDRTRALEILKSDRDALGAGNVNYGAVELIVTPWLG